MKLAEKIKWTLQEKLCPVHDVHPIVEIAGEEINIACCCTYFKRFCQIEAEYLYTKLSNGITAEKLIHAI